MAYRLFNTTYKLEKILRQRLIADVPKTNINSSPPGVVSVETLLQKWRDLCENPPKGFEKYFEPKSGKNSKGSKKSEPSQESGESKHSKPPPSSSPQKGDRKDWNLGAFGNDAGGRGSRGRFDGNEKEKWIYLGGLGTIASIGAIVYLQVKNREITWRDFANSYLAKNIVERLEVVNKKWVRVKLQPGSSMEPRTLWFNIGSVDSFERNLETAQLDLNIDPPNYVPVFYK